MRKLLSLSLIVSALWLNGSGSESLAQQPGAPLPAVAVAAVLQKEITPSDTYTGRVEAVDTVQIRARVEGFIEKRLFDDGADVKAGDLLVVLEKAPYEAQIGEIKGQITAAEGALRLAEIDVNRQRQLVEKQAAAQERQDVAEANHKQSFGQLQRLQASLIRAELNLSYTDIKAPIDGRIGRFAYSVGDYVTPSSDRLADIVKQDPIYVTFPVSTRVLLEVRKRAEAQGRDLAAVAIKLRLPDGSIYSETGRPNFLDVQADRTTDTVTVRAVFPNPRRILVDKELVGVIVEQVKPEQALLIPQAAVVIDQAGPYVLIVDKNNKVEQRRIRPGSQEGSDVAVTEGLKENEQVIIEGLQKVRPGQQVQVVASSAPAAEVAQ
ncbi:efflux RND transporter periplasmic adaptor subunit [Rhizobium mesoamericanum]|uniref:Efflux pump periplasmic linker bepF n=1 Tax=Rhizobium mesoamericanum STM3625 TaxID=1211777 RepID=K0Q2K7_9HYPH|nr:efflux RND transporter periplasmic adaptor subunit [Rhizobium mesoamericanum]CCM76749.1 Efflux pump periplasmic linker bepF [Rhizobium mesoamericanum STM3625]